jgi:hypothetical protein
LDLCSIFRSSWQMFYLVAPCMVVHVEYTLQDVCTAGIRR